MAKGENFEFVVLAAGKPLFSDSAPAVEEVIGKSNALRWNLAAAGVEGGSVSIVAGFDVKRIRDNFPDATVIENPHWRNTLSAGSLFCVSSAEQNRPALVAYSDIVFSEKLASRLREGKADVSVAWDPHFLPGTSTVMRADIPLSESVAVEEGRVVSSGRLATGVKSAGFFPGLIYLSSKAREFLEQIDDNKRIELGQFHLSELVEYMRHSGLRVRAVDAHQNWARVDDPDDLARFILGSKADTLVRLRPLVKKSWIPECFVFTVEQWVENPGLVMSEIFLKFPDTVLIIRSSSLAEDSFDESQAGAFLSKIGVRGEAQTAQAINEVIGSYPRPQAGDQVLVQPAVVDLIANGVAVTRTLGDAAPWISINFEESNGSDGVTSGSSQTSQTFHLFRYETEKSAGAKERVIQSQTPDWMPALLSAIKELEKILHYNRLDIEFGITSAGKIALFQVRPLVYQTPHSWPTDSEYKAVISHAKQEWLEHQKSVVSRFPEAPAVLSNMTDWNPAEILGVTPHALALSLYRSLITDAIWAQSRAYFGYRHVPLPLLKTIAGRPFIDVVSSIESFIPARLAEPVAQRLVGFYAQCLVERPELHDKLEFDVVPTCLTPSFDSWQARLSEDAKLDAAEIAAYADGLKDVTVACISSISEDLEKVAELTQQFERVTAVVGTPSVRSVRDAIELCRELGTLPFSNMARRGFVAVTLLRGAVASGLIDQEAADQFMRTVSTVSHEIGQDASRVKEKNLTWDCFVEKYGHLRPGTYDISSPRYDSAPDVFLQPLVDKSSASPEEEVSNDAWESQKESLLNWVQQLDPTLSHSQIEDFLRSAIEGRESTKFAFTRVLSWILEELRRIGGMWGFSSQELSHLSLEDFHLFEELDKDPLDQRAEIVRRINANKQSHSISSTLKLPSIIRSESDLWTYTTGHEIPNFVGRSRVVAQKVHLGGEAPGPLTSIENHIVLIEAADPGFDWIFGHNIAGLVTTYGGANSHMAIRAAEFGLPAAIGIGEARFESLISHTMLELDPPNQVLRGV